MHDETYPVGDIHGHHEKFPVSEIDDIHNSPDQAQTGSHEGVNHAVQKPVQGNLQKERHAFRVPPFDTVPPCGTRVSRKIRKFLPKGQ